MVSTLCNLPGRNLSKNLESIWFMNKSVSNSMVGSSDSQPYNFKLTESSFLSVTVTFVLIVQTQYGALSCSPEIILRPGTQLNDAPVFKWSNVTCQTDGAKTN